MDAGSGRASDEARDVEEAQIRTLLAAADAHAADARLRARFGDLGAAFSAALGSWIEPLAAAMQGREPTTRSRAAARALTDVARLTGVFADDAAQRLAGDRTSGRASSDSENYAELAARIDDAYREFSASAEFDRARRRAAAAVLDWLEQDGVAAVGLAGILESTSTHALRPGADSTREDRVVVMRDGNATLVRCTTDRACGSSVLVVPGFTTGAELFDLVPERSVSRTLAAHGVETWLLDWGRSDESDRLRGVANQLERIDRAIESMRREANGRSPALAGHFHGGLLALLYCIRHPGRVRALVALSTPVEFASPEDVFANWVRACDGERLVDVLGNVPGPLVSAMIAAVSPMGWCGGTFLNLLEGMDSASGATRMARFEQARRCPPGFPGETFRGLYRAFYRDNSFAGRGDAMIDGFRYNLADLATPVLNVCARDDRVVPPGASIPLEHWAAAAVSSRERRCGHLDLLTGKETHEELLPDIAAWLTAHAGDPRTGGKT